MDHAKHCEDVLESCVGLLAKQHLAEKVYQENWQRLQLAEKVLSEENPAFSKGPANHDCVKK
jgi:hypothetical protein